ncbi:DNA methyltransferase [Bifidobacterium sp. DSM 109958]|uniref:DNA methyltransferase n=1 Tax=Bifidobacterium moraviense TaxID=2675323 RepID=A0A7Y0F2C0_9BIFI|nr:16S rRNA (guanine(966)-N(2))-methyltransferase RsmD [Bifidobacterium sp. DSM 109958]NMN00766.1 DNA methyltransferase [Bifidobacterium sp. DSM 109958]
MRVIAGRFKGFQLPAAKTGTRPTTDRTKEAIFSHLDSWGVIDDARVLDLYAGTGALGIEALSRGARELVAVEMAGPAATALNGTLASLRRAKAWESGMAAHLVRGKAEAFVNGYRGGANAADGDAAPGFDLIFIDPPYAMTTEDCDALLAGIAANGVAADDAIIMVERSTRSAAVSAPEGWEITQSRAYGETSVSYIERA